MAFTWGSALRISVLLILVAAIVLACYFLPVEKLLKDFLLWVEQDLGPWGPFALAVAYIPLTVLAVPASVLTVYIHISFVCDIFTAIIHSQLSLLE